MRIYWSPASDTVTASGDIRYQLFKSTATSGDCFTQMGASGNAFATSVPWAASGYSDTSVSAGVTYYYGAVAVAGAGTRSTGRVVRSAAVLDTTPPVFAGLLTATSGANKGTQV